MPINEHDFNYLVIIWILIALPVFILLLKINAPYGRFNKSSWKPQISTTAGWIIMEFPSLLLFTTIYWINFSSLNLVTLFLFLIFFMHYLNRSLVFPLRSHNRNKKMPLLIVLSGIFFNAINASVNSYFLSVFADYQVSWFYDPRFILGLIIFIAGFVINNQSDSILLRLKASGKGYQIPQEGLFKWVSSPNYFGEILEWVGFAFMAWSLPSLSFAIWTIANLLPRALSNHKWYNSYFEEYPKERKAIFPYIL